MHSALATSRVSSRACLRLICPTDSAMRHMKFGYGASWYIYLGGLPSSASSSSSEALLLAFSSAKKHPLAHVCVCECGYDCVCLCVFMSVL